MHQQSSISKPLIISNKDDDLIVYGTLPIELQKFSHKSFDKNGTHFFPRDYFYIIDQMKASNIEFTDQVKPDINLGEDSKFQKDYTLHDFQQQTVEKWLQEKSGTVILPTGSGKSVIAIEILALMKVKTLIVVPTLVLFEQWKTKIVNFLGITENSIGFYGGGDKDVCPITIITYDSASLYAHKLNNQFGLIILDEAHHINAKSYQIILDAYMARYRLAMTATLNKSEVAYKLLVNHGFGPVIVEQTVSQLKIKDTKILSNFILKRIKVKIERIDEYKSNINILQSYIKENNLRGDVFQKIILQVNRNPKAELALRAYQNARKIAFAANEKLKIINDIFENHLNEKIIIFSDEVEFCERISREFLIPCITYKTKKKERTFIMNYFQKFKSAKIIASTILDEGVDVPDVGIGIIVAGSGRPRQFIQRLGRLLRTSEGKEQAILYELVSINTMEISASRRRKKNL